MMGKRSAAWRRSCGGEALHGGAVAPASGEPVREFVTMIDEDLRRLSRREEQVLRLLFGIGELRHSREELGRRLAISRNWLRQIELRALSNLRNMAVAVADGSTAKPGRPALRSAHARPATYRGSRLGTPRSNQERGLK
jgi:hypothetical protein